MATCPKCGAVYDESATSCVADGSPLLPVELCLPAEPFLAAGTMVGEYRISRKLGAGTFGEVYAGEHPLIGKKVAIKVLNRRFAAQPQAVARFVAEARAVNRIRQRNIIDIFSFGVLPGLQRHYFVMELLDGMTLGELCRRRRRLPFPTIVPIVRGIAAALDAAHEAGITHRDLKPDNVFLAAERDGTWFPKLLDFGIAKLADGESPEETSTGAVLGTPQYMAPEQARGHRTGPAADIYALGVMIHKMLTGRSLFAGESAVEVMCRHASDPPPRMSSVCADLPRELDLPVLAMLQKRASDRPPSASKAVADLLEVARKIGLGRASAPEEPGAAPVSATGATWTLEETVPSAMDGEGRESATWISDSETVSSAMDGEGRESATWPPDSETVSSAMDGEGRESATWTPGKVTSGTEDATAQTMGFTVATGPAATVERSAADSSDAGTFPASELSGSPPSSTLPATESAPEPPASAGDTSTLPLGLTALGADPVRAADPARASHADGRSSTREVTATEAPSAAPVARVAVARRRKLVIGAAAGLLAATSAWAVGRPSGLPTLDAPSAMALASAPVAPAAPPAPLSAAPPAPLSAAPPAPLSAAPPAPLPAPPAETVAVRLSTRPADASVWIGDRKVGSSSAPLALPRGSEPVELVLRKPGFKDARVKLSPDRDREMDVTLSPLPAPRRGASAARDTALSQGRLDTLLDQRE
ncbi:protein kinase domain-containing protein [Sorangium sp. So ce1128]